MLLCKDCIWFRETLFEKFISFNFFKKNSNFAKCGRPKPEVIIEDHVKGGSRIEASSLYCETERNKWSHLDLCGLEGKYWEGKEKK